jgi:hypothetical protein
LRAYAESVLSVDLAIYADALAGEVAALTARAERLRMKLREAGIERAARRALPPRTVEQLEAIGLLRTIDERSVRAELSQLEDALEAVAQLQAWVEEKLDSATAA